MVLFRVRRNSWFWVTAVAGAVAAHMVLCWPPAVARGYPPIHPWHLLACYVAPFGMIIPPLFDDGRDRPKRRMIRIALVSMAFAFIWVVVEVARLMNPRHVSIWDIILQFGWLAVMAVWVLPLAWPGLVLLVGGIIAASITGTKVENDRFMRACRWGLSPLVLSFSILMCGALFWDGFDSGLRWPAFMINLLLLAHIPLAAVLAFFQAGARWFVLALSVAILGYSIGAWAMSGMAITGDWL